MSVLDYYYLARLRLMFLGANILKQTPIDCLSILRKHVHMISLKKPLAADARRLVYWLLPFAFIYGVLSGLNWPATYTLTHMIIDYHFGFGKRGLIGTLLRLIDRPPYHYMTLVCMAFGTFILWFAVLVITAWRPARRDLGIAIAFLLFLLSAGFASLVCDVGRGEHFGLLFALPCLLMPVSCIWILIRAMLLVSIILMQEANFLIVVPFVAFDVWIADYKVSISNRAISTACVVLPAIAMTSYLGNVQSACNTLSSTAYFQRLAADFPVRSIPVGTLCLNARNNIGLVWQALWSTGPAAAVVPLALIVALPSALFTLRLTSQTLRNKGLGVLPAVFAALAPLSLLILAADVVRFVTLIQATSLIVLLSAARRIGQPEGGTLTSAPKTGALVVALTAFQLGTGLTLNDGTQMLKFPFVPLVVRAVAVAEHLKPFVVIQ